MAAKQVVAHAARAEPQEVARGIAAGSRCRGASRSRSWNRWNRHGQRLRRWNIIRSRFRSMSSKRAPPAPPLAAAASVGSDEPVRPECAARHRRASKPLEHPEYQLPSTELLNEVPARSSYDSLELKELAARIKSKFEEFNVHGAVVQINPGPVVTTFEFKPEAGIKYSRIIALMEDLCSGCRPNRF